MSVEPPPPRLRPLGFGEILDVSFKICTAKAVTLLKAVCVTVIPLQVLAAIVVISTIGEDAYSTTGSFDTSTSSEEEVDVEWSEIAGFVVLIVLSAATYLLSIGACFRAIAQAYLGRDVDWRGSVAYALRRSGSLLWISFLFALAVALGFAVVAVVVVLASLGGLALGLLVGIPLGLAAFAAYVWITIAWSLSYPALFVEDVRGRAALKRSFALVKGNWWRTFAVLLVGYIIASAIAFAVQFAIALPVIVGVDEDTIAGVTLNVASTIVGTLISTPLISAIVAVVYFDLRVRREGFDLELLAQQIGEHGPAVGPSPAVKGFAPPPGPYAPGPYGSGPYAPEPPPGGPAWGAPPSNPQPSPYHPPPAPYPPAPRFVKGPVPPQQQEPPPTYAPPGTAPPAPPRHPDEPSPESGFAPPRPPERDDDR